MRLLFTVALLAWLIAGALFTTRYLVALIEERGRLPFVLGAVWLAASNTFETALYWYIVWFDIDNAELTRIALFVIPIGLASQAVAHMVIAWWVLNGGGSRGKGK
jgi:hypothetical protein